MDSKVKKNLSLKSSQSYSYRSISTLAGDKDRDVREKARIFIDAYGS